MNKKISVIIPVYNTERYIAETVRSALHQTYTDWEIIAVDDGSTDDSAKIIEGFSPSITLVQQENRGCAAACTTGIQAAQGTYIQILGADDILHPEKFARQMAVFKEEPSLDAVFCTAEKFSGESPLYTHSHKSKKSESFKINSKELLDSLLKKNTISAITPLVKKVWYERVGYYDVRLTNLEDWNAYLRMAHLDASFYYLDEVLAGIRRHESNKSDNAETMNRARVKVLDYFFADYGNAFTEKQVRNAYAHCYLENARLSHANHNYAQFRRDFMRACGLHPFFYASSGLIVKYLRSYLRTQK